MFLQKTFHPLQINQHLPSDSDAQLCDFIDNMEVPPQDFQILQRRNHAFPFRSSNN